MADRLAAARTRAATAGFVLATLPLAALLILRLLGIGGNRYIVGALALTPYIAACGAVLGCACLMLRRWRIGAVVLVLTIVLAATLLPRLLPNDQPSATGTVIRVMSVDLDSGSADAASVVERVREHNVDVLCLLELTPDAVFELQEAGLFSVLRHQMLRPLQGSGGFGIVARYTLRQQRLPAEAAPAGFRALVDVPGARRLDVVAVNAPRPTEALQRWESVLGALPAWQEQGPVRLLAGDFNATLDHAALREILDTGYVDAAAQVGEGLTPTWPAGLFPPPIAIDHILTGQLTAVRDYAVLDISGSDHKAVYAEITLPA